VCGTCGCGEVEHDHPHTHTVSFETNLLAKNDALATANRGWFAAHQVTAVNLMSSPGSGKTTLLVRSISDLAGEIPIAVIEGDQETALDADRIATTGASVVQINTGSGCHLDATMVERGIAALEPSTGAMVMVENVGNLVCPSLFDLGEAARVVIVSVTEGADKPLKYPQMFRTANLVVLNKIDLAPYVDFDTAEFTSAVGRVNPAVDVLALSATKGDGLDAWYDWLRSLHNL
jgi:hydrogenase nickel incorporation protein HypB